MSSETDADNYTFSTPHDAMVARKLGKVYEKHIAKLERELNETNKTINDLRTEWKNMLKSGKVFETTPSLRDILSRLPIQRNNNEQ